MLAGGTEKSTIFPLLDLLVDPSTVSDKWRAQIFSFATSFKYFPYKHWEKHRGKDLQMVGFASLLSIFQVFGPSHSCTSPS